MPVKLLVTADDDTLISVPNEREVLATKIPEALMRKIKIVGYTHSHHILVRFHRQHAGNIHPERMVIRRDVLPE